MHTRTVLAAFYAAGLLHAMTTVVAAVIERHGRILICQRRRGQAHELKWEFPGGKVEPGETPQAALRRELREELAIHASIDGEITRYQFAYPGRPPILLIFFRVTDYTEEPRNLVFERMEWEPPGRLEAYDFLEGDLDFIRTYSALEPGRQYSSSDKDC